MNSQLRARLETADPIFVSKGHNRGTIEKALQDEGISMPRFIGRGLVASQSGKQWVRTRDGDMVTCLRERPTGLGFMGSDRFGELSEDQQQGLVFQTFASTATRFALATIPEKANGLAEKIDHAEPIVIATTYPRGARQAISALGGAEDAVETVYIGGGVEMAPTMFPRVDGVFDLVHSGETLAANNLQIVHDDLDKLSVGALWMEQQAA